MNTKTIRRRASFWSIPLALFALGTFTLTVPGCNTTEGLGKDIEATGDAIEDAARDAND